MVVMMTWSYRDRTHAGQILAKMLGESHKEVTQGSVLVLAVPNGGVCVAEPIASAFSAELGLIIVRKVQIPFNTEAGFGAVTSLGDILLNEELLPHLHLSDKEIHEAIEKTKRHIAEREHAYSGLGVDFSPRGRDVIIVDDGLASGYTMMAAIRSVRTASPKSITVAVPTASYGAVKRVRTLVDSLVCPRVERGWSFAVAEAYERWYDVSDEEVVRILRGRRMRH